MPSQYNSFSFYLSLFLLGLCVSSLTIKDFEIYDLQTNSTDFFNEASQWKLSTTNPYNQVYTFCGGIYLLGGFEVTWTPSVHFKRTYESLKPHNTIFMTLDFWLLGSWNVFDSVNIQAFSTMTLSFSHTLHPIIPPAKWTPTTCDNADLDLLMPMTVFAQFPHSSNSLSLDISCQSQKIPGQDLALCGLRNIQILSSFHNKNPELHIFKNSMLVSVLPSISMECSPGQYKDSNTQICVPCDANCENCFNQSSQSCLSCKKGFFYNSTHCTPCHAECSTCFGASRDQCLSCANGKFLYRNGTCSSLCDPLYLNRTIAGILLCEFPCDRGQYLYPNGPCLSICSLPMLQRDSPDGKYCDSPCKDPNYYYYPVEKLCQSTCPDPYSIIFKHFYRSCFVPLTPEALDYVIFISGGLATIGLITTSIISMSDPMAILFGVVSMMNHYIKYLNISYSEEFEKRLTLQDSSSISLDFWVHRSNLTNEEFQNSPLPYIFKKRNLQPSFMENFLPYLVILFIFIGIPLGFRVSEWIYHRLKRTNFSTHIVRKIRIRTQNLLITVLYMIFPNILFFSILDFKSPRHHDNVDDIGSLIFSILILVAIKIFWMHFNIISLQAKIMDNEIIVTPEDLKDFYRQNKPVQVLFRGFEEDSFRSQIFLLFFMGRGILFILAITLVDQDPLLQGIFLVILSLLMLLYLLIYEPLKNKIQQRFYSISEFTLLLVNCSVYTIAKFDTQHKLSSSVRDGLGKLIVSMEIIANFLALFYVILALFRHNFLYKQTQNNMENIPLRFEADAHLSDNKKTQQANECMELKVIDSRPHEIDIDKSLLPINFVRSEVLASNYHYKKSKSRNKAVFSQDSEDSDTHQEYALENLSEQQEEKPDSRPFEETAQRNSINFTVNPSQDMILSKTFKRTKDTQDMKPLKKENLMNDLI